MPSPEFWNSLKNLVEPSGLCGSDCHAEITESIGKLQIIIAGLKRHLNTHRPAAAVRLPPEVLGKILFYTAQPERDDDTFYGESGPALIRTLQRITRVCSTWRNVALGNPLLWIHIPVGNQRCTRVFMERNKNLDITLVGSVPDPGGNKACHFLAAHEEHLHRVASLSIMLSIQYPDVALPSRSAPRLQTLEIVSDCEYISIKSNPPYWDTPALKVLLLKSVGPSWAWVGTLISLTSLTIDQCPMRSRTTPTHLLNTLRNLQFLSALCLRDVFDWESSIGPVEDDLADPVTLPKLQRVLLTGSSSALSPFLAHLRLPNNVLLHLEMSSSTMNSQARHLVPAIAQNHKIRITDGGLQKGPYRGLALDFFGDSIILQAVQDGQQMYDNPPLRDRDDFYRLAAMTSCRDQLLVEVDTPFWRGDVENFSDFLDDLVKHDMLSPETLVIIGEPGSRIQKMLLYWILRRWALLTRIMFFSSFSWFAEEFASTQDVSGKQTPLRPPFLREVHIRNFDFRMQPDRPDTIQEVIAGIGRRQAGATASRGTSESPPIAIDIRDCYIEPDQVHALRMACEGQVEWDGQTREDPWICYNSS